MKKLLTLLLLSPLAFAEEIDWSKYKTQSDLTGLTEEQIDEIYEKWISEQEESE